MMRLVTDDLDTTPLVLDQAIDALADWPAEVDMILSAMDAAAHPADARPAADRRASTRQARRAKADLRLYAQNPLDPPIQLFTRDISATGVGFITKERLPLGYNGLIRIEQDDGEVVTASCQVYRCREAIGGWYEGAIHFSQRQPNLF